jgi:hypothetical protein
MQKYWFSSDFSSSQYLCSRVPRQNRRDITAINIHEQDEQTIFGYHRRAIESDLVLPSHKRGVKIAERFRAERIILFFF